jgi:uncharacterized protein YmfQ (DUF2313 family)
MPYLGLNILELNQFIKVKLMGVKILVAERQADLIERWEKIHGLDNQRRRTRQSDQRS